MSSEGPRFRPPHPRPQTPEAFPLPSSTVCLRHRDRTGSAPRCRRLIKAGLKGRRQEEGERVGEGEAGGLLAAPGGLVAGRRGSAIRLAFQPGKEEQR